MLGDDRDPVIHSQAHLHLDRPGLTGRTLSQWILVNVSTLINFFFALFELPTGNGWTVLFINIVILLLNNTGETKRWVRLSSPTTLGGYAQS